MRIAVTGATGSIGRTLVPLLAAKGCDVLALGRNAAIGETLMTTRTHFRAGDLAHDPVAPLLVGIDAVVHLAARSSPWGPRSSFVRDNVMATRRLLDAMEVAGVRRLVHASTPSIFCERAHRIGLRSASTPARRPVNAYAETKLEAERLVRERKGLSIMILRPSAVVGPHDTAIVPRIMRVIRRGILPIGDPNVLFHPTAVHDAAEAFAVAATGEMTGCANVAGPEPVPVAEMARSLADAVNLKVRVPVVAEPLLHGAGRMAEVIGAAIGREPPITRYSACTLSWSRTFDVDETARLLGWRPVIHPMEALARAVVA